MNDRRLERLRRRMVARQARERGRAAANGLYRGSQYWLLVAAVVFLTTLLGLIAFWREL